MDPQAGQWEKCEKEVKEEKRVKEKEGEGTILCELSGHYSFRESSTLSQWVLL